MERETTSNGAVRVSELATGDDIYRAQGEEWRIFDLLKIRSYISTRDPSIDRALRRWRRSSDCKKAPALREQLRLLRELRHAQPLLQVLRRPPPLPRPNPNPNPTLLPYSFPFLPIFIAAAAAIVVLFLLVLTRSRVRVRFGRDRNRTGPVRPGPAEPVRGVPEAGRADRVRVPVRATFCGAHATRSATRAGFDYKAAGRVALARANPLVKADKLPRI
uniref:Uncharacterized protein n=1 Tax=Ananas comosus var. bracteatus TaxID=296719 RepID=A0A6V7Q125_ANACO|nr:unnamed protein product [Ananas comosus var. bracteatus]